MCKAPRAKGRKTRCGRNGREAKACRPRTHYRTGAACRDLAHKSTAPVSQNHPMAWTGRPVGNKPAAATGTAGEPGRRVRSQSGLNQSIPDQE